MRGGRVGAGLALALAITTAAGSPAPAQDQVQTLADIRQELSVLYVEVQRLKSELNTTGAPAVTAGGGSMTDRVNAIEAELSRMIARTEELEYHIDKVVSDGTNRIGDLSFRLCELEPDCDITATGPTKPLGGQALAGPAPAVDQPSTDPGAEELAVGEQADFDAASTALQEGSYEDAAARFKAFTETYTGGPLTGEAHFLRGEALAGLGQTKEAARSYLASFSGDPNGPRAPEALYKLGAALGQLGQQNEACVTLNEVGVRFPDAPAWTDAQAEMSRLGCN